MILEICIGSLEDGLIAVDNGADRLELNSCLEFGGLSPSIATLRLLKEQTKVPIICMVRPRPGGFLYSESDWLTIQRETDLYLEYGADGIACGFLTCDFKIDCKRTGAIKSLLGKSEFVFHRAFDWTDDANEAAKSLIDCGVNRVLTSGQAAKAPEGADVLGELQARFGEQIEILPGSGIRAENVVELVRKTKVSQIHAGLRMSFVDKGVPTEHPVSFHPVGMAQDLSQTDGKAVKALSEALSKL